MYSKVEVSNLERIKITRKEIGNLMRIRVHIKKKRLMINTKLCIRLKKVELVFFVIVVDVNRYTHRKGSLVTRTALKTHVLIPCNISQYLLQCKWRCQPSVLEYEI